MKGFPYALQETQISSRHITLTLMRLLHSPLLLCEIAVSENKTPSTGAGKG